MFAHFRLRVLSTFCYLVDLRYLCHSGHLESVFLQVTCWPLVVIRNYKTMLSGWKLISDHEQTSKVKKGVLRSVKLRCVKLEISVED